MGMFTSANVEDIITTLVGRSIVYLTAKLLARIVNSRLLRAPTKK